MPGKAGQPPEAGLARWWRADLERMDVSFFTSRAQCPPGAACKFTARVSEIDWPEPQREAHSKLVIAARVAMDQLEALGAQCFDIGVKRTDRGAASGGGKNLSEGTDRTKLKSGRICRSFLKA